MTMTNQAPIAKAQMLIRRPVAEVFQAFVDPAITTRFWFTKSSGKLEAGKRIRWDWEMYGVHDEVEVGEIEEDRRILMEWSFPNSNRVEWTFEARPGETTFVTVINSAFKGDDVAAQAADSTAGFNIVLCACKVFLEHGIEPGFVADHAPDALVKDGKEAGKSRSQLAERKSAAS